MEGAEDRHRQQREQYTQQHDRETEEQRQARFEKRRESYAMHCNEHRQSTQPP